MSVSGAGAWRARLARLVLAGEDALLDPGEADLADTQLLAGRHDLGLDNPEQRVLLDWLETNEIFRSRASA